MRRKNGFTLLEVLAVIVVLAIIALITVPLVMNAIDSAKRGAFESSAYGIISSGDYYVAKKAFKNENYAGETLDLPEAKDKLGYKGSVPTDGKLIIKNKESLALVMHDTKFCAIKEFDQDKVTITDYDKETCKLEVTEVEKAPTVSTSYQLYNEDQNASLSIVATSEYGIRSVKYLQGNQPEDTVATSGIPIALQGEQYVVNGLTQNGYYTVYVEDQHGNTTMKRVVIEGIIVLEGSFEDLYVSGSFGALSSSWGSFRRTLTINTKNDVKIVDARYTKGYSYDDISSFENNTSFGDKIDYEEDRMSFTATGLWLQRVTVYVKYEYQEEVKPGKFEPRYASKIYKTRFSNVFGD